jgi:hypothetical protein
LRKTATSKNVKILGEGEVWENGIMIDNNAYMKKL